MTVEVETPAVFATLAQDRSLLARSSTVERVAEILRERIIEGVLPPDTRLAEDAIGSALGVSRNTLREAFRQLSHEGLVVHKHNRGVFVRRLFADDVIDLYRLRRLIEPAALTEDAQMSEERLHPLRAAITAGEQAASEGRGGDVGTANMRFHQAIAALADSPRIDLLMRRLLAELRLVFHAVEHPGAFHESYLHRNREILTMLERGATREARQALLNYLSDAEQRLLAAY